MAELERPSRALVVGIGSEIRGEDAVGLQVVRSLREGPVPDADLLEDPGDLLRLLDLWEGRRSVTLVDAVRTGAPRGTVHRWDLSDPNSVPAGASFSTHGFSLAHALHLAAALGRAPARVVLYGVEVGETSPGSPISAEVSRGGAEVARRVREEIGSGGQNDTGSRGARAHA